MLNSAELLFVVDEHNVPGFPLPRSEVHAKGIWHRVADVFVVTKEGLLLCQKRSLKKDADPGKWECFVGGHMSPGSDARQAAAQELFEETGIKMSPTEFQELPVYRFEQEHEYMYPFYVVWSGRVEELVKEVDEVDEFKLLSIATVLTNYYPAHNPLWSRVGLEIPTLTLLQEKFATSSL